MQPVKFGARDAPDFLLVLGVGRDGWWCAGLPIHGECGNGVAAGAVFRIDGAGVIVGEMNRDVIARARHRRVQLRFFEHRCLPGVRASHEAASFAAGWSHQDRRARHSVNVPQHGRAHIMAGGGHIPTFRANRLRTKNIGYLRPNTLHREAERRT